jgi:TRAP-type C4-dicarboxylate transport system permease small subunit
MRGFSHRPKRHTAKIDRLRLDMPQPTESGLSRTAHPHTHSETPEAPEAPVQVPLKIEDWLAVLIMAALALMTLANVLVRYFTNASFAWTEEISVFLMIALTLVASSAATARDRHIRIQFFAGSGPAWRQRLMSAFAAGAVAVLFALLGLLSLRVAWDDYRFGETSPGIGVPQWWYSMWLPVLALAIAGRAVGLLLRRLRQGADT